jgi:hypothetical protein
LNVQAPGAGGELEPFVRAENAEFVGLLMAFHLRRGAARIGAVNYGTAHSMTPEIVSTEVRELSLYYHLLLERSEKEEESLDLYEAVATKQLEIDTWLLELGEGPDDERRRMLLTQIDKALVEMQSMTEKMEKLSDA